MCIDGASKKHMINQALHHNIRDVDGKITLIRTDKPNPIFDDNVSGSKKIWFVESGSVIQDPDPNPNIGSVKMTALFELQRLCRYAVGAFLMSPSKRQKVPLPLSAEKSKSTPCERTNDAIDHQPNQSEHHRRLEQRTSAEAADRRDMLTCLMSAKRETYVTFGAA
uniref:Uncharacterized protein n=1 Tax=Romanomermis culicivorax TaxID=13658 RepID=A0A915I840_ROMCU